MERLQATAAPIWGRAKKQATAAVEALALRLIADRLEHGEALPGPMNVTFIAA
jgi:hypothetical protein